MYPKLLASLLAASHLISSAWGFGTIVQVYPATCAALPTVSPGIPMLYLLSVSPGPIDITPRAVSQTYLKADGSTTSDCTQAAAYFLSDGRLANGAGYVSTSGLVPYSPLAASPYLSAISTVFSVANGTSLSWTNSVFVGSRAIFCLLGNVVQAVYNGNLPGGCAQAYINVSPAFSCPNYTIGGSTLPPTTSGTSPATSSPSSTPQVPGTIATGNTTAYPLGCYSLNATNTALQLGPNTVPQEVGTLEQCADKCTSFAYFGVANRFCICSNQFLPSAELAPFGSCNVTCINNSQQTCGGTSAAVIYSILRGSGGSSTTTAIVTSTSSQTFSSTMSGTGSNTGSSSTISPGTGSSSTMTATTSSSTTYTTSTGVPNCFARSPFDMTVNGGYLVLCNTDLEGANILTTNGTSLFECIAACNAQRAGSTGGPCVAVTFNIAAMSNQCGLKGSISSITAGANDLSEAAVLVVGSSAPTISFVSPTPSSTSINGTSTMTTISTSTSSSTLLTTPLPSTTGTSSTTSSSLTSSATSVPSVSSSSSASSVSNPSSSATASSSSPFSSTTAATSASSLSSSLTGTTTTQSPRPTVTNPVGPLCPTYNGQVVRISGILYHVQCNTNLLGTALTGNTTTATSLSDCAGQCNLYNLAVPTGCLGAIYLTTISSANCILYGAVTGTRFVELEDSIRLIYPGYPSASDPVLTATGTSSRSARSTTSTPTTSSTSTTTTFSAAPTATASLCPAYNLQTVFFPTYGEVNYQIECQTTFIAGDLSAVIAVSLTDCINQCSFLNLNSETVTCVGVTYSTFVQPSPPLNNCFLKNVLATFTRGVLLDDSARLIA